ncbi:MAG: hypothetical protein Q4E75_06225, partial [bacterium]|nr:hypothetical protein [bacterium]
GCSVGGKSIEYTYGKSKQLCTFANEGEEGKVGAKYTCKVNNKDTFTFYITNLLDIAGKTISQSDTETKVEYYDLILDSNICEDGSLDTNDECSSVWVSETDYNSYAVGKGVGYNQNGCIDKGPITAMKYLYNSTKSWTNVPTISLSYEDRHTDGLGRPGSVGVPYGGIISNGTTTEIRMNDGTVTATFENMKARLPRFFDTIYNSDGTNIWTFETCGQGGPCSSQNYALFYAWGAQSDYSSIKSSYKIRPVITVLPSDLGL